MEYITSSSDYTEEELQEPNSFLQKEVEELENLREGYIKMDFTLTSPEERVKKVEEIIANTPAERLTPLYLTKLADYIIYAMDKQEKQEKKIITDNRLITINKRETSFEGLVSHFENSENTGDIIYNMVANDKNIIFRPKFKITEEDLETVPKLKELKEEIEKLEIKCKALRGKAAYNLKKQIIAMRQDQYVMKNAYKPITVNCVNTIKCLKKLDLAETIFINEEGKVESTGFINFFNTKHIFALLSNYEKLKQENWANCAGDAKWMLMDLEDIIEKALGGNPILKDIAYYKMYSYTNAEIQEILKNKYKYSYSIEYLSSLWKNKIPKLIAETATKEWLDFHYTYEEKGYWKKCSRCGEVKLGNSYYFSKNNASKDKLYSICKSCRKIKREAGITNQSGARKILKKGE